MYEIDSLTDAKHLFASVNIFLFTGNHVALFVTSNDSHVLCDSKQKPAVTFATIFKIFAFQCIFKN